MTLAWSLTATAAIGTVWSAWRRYFPQVSWLARRGILRTKGSSASTTIGRAGSSASVPVGRITSRCAISSPAVIAVAVNDHVKLYPIISSETWPVFW
jgi:hypothetical protein